MSQEYEIKFSLPEKTLNQLTKWLKENAEFEGEETHREVYLNNPKQTFKFKDDEDYIDSLDYMRVRFSNKGDSVCIKHFYTDPKNPKATTHCDEIEYDVSNGELALDLFKQIGFVDNSEMKKTRKKYKHDFFEIVIDSVMGVGDFIEIEVKKDFRNYKDAYKSIYDLLRKIKIKKIRKHKRGYISMLWNNNHDFGEEFKI